MDSTTICSSDREDRDHRGHMEMENIARENLLESLSVIPDVEKAAYLEALERAPRLVEMESNPMYFVQRENFNSWAAAQRIVSYWKQRKIVFGDRAFLPLTLTSESALSGVAVCALRKGTMMVLPNDAKGRSVVYLDRSEFLALPCNVRIEMIFYITFIAAHNSKVLQKELVIVALMPALAVGVLDPDSGERIFHIMRTCLPIMLHQLHLFFHETETAAAKFVPMVLQVINEQTNHARIRMHFCIAPEKRASKLLPFGFSREFLPESLGGSWGVKLWDRPADVNPLPCENASLSRATQKVPGLVRNQNLSCQLSSRPVLASSEENGVNKGKARENIEQALELIPDDDKAAYLEATKCAPHLVENESGPMKFLEINDFNAWDAAGRIISYWKERKNIFGDRAFRPLSLTPEGAFSDVTVRAIREGICHKLPNDSEGRTVLYVNQSKLRNLPLNVRLEIVF